MRALLSSSSCCCSRPCPRPSVPEAALRMLLMLAAVSGFALLLPALLLLGEGAVEARCASAEALLGCAAGAASPALALLLAAS